MSKGRAAAIARLHHMLEATDTIIGYTTRGRELFDTDSALRDAILYQVVVLGEAAKAALATDPSLETVLPEVEWSPIARMRDMGRAPLLGDGPRSGVGHRDGGRARIA